MDRFDNLKYAFRDDDMVDMLTIFTEREWISADI